MSERWFREALFSALARFVLTLPKAFFYAEDKFD
jgi:hypothetical protein